MRIFGMVQLDHGFRPMPFKQINAQRTIILNRLDFNGLDNSLKIRIKNYKNLPLGQADNQSITEFKRKNQKIIGGQKSVYLFFKEDRFLTIFINFCNHMNS